LIQAYFSPSGWDRRSGLSRSRGNRPARKKAGLVSEETRGKCTIYAIDREAVAAALVAFHSILRA